MKREVYDLHSHILPGIDDGSKNLEVTLSMLEEERTQGVSHIAFTPHFYAQKTAFHQYLIDRADAYEKVKSAMAERDMDLDVKLAAEVYYFKGMGRSDILHQLCLEGTDYVFVEMPFCQWEEDVYSDIKNILNVLQLKVMVVHIERYYPFQKDKSIWREVFSLPVIPQVNTGCFFDFKEKRIATKFIKKDYPLVLGSDCHNMRNRKPNLLEGRNFLEKKFGASYLADVDERSEKIWLNK